MVCSRNAFRWIKISPIGILLGIFVLLGLIYSITTPIFEAPDEPGHYQYVKYLAAGNGLPVQSFERAKLIVDEGHQPPLYYAMAAALTFWIDLSNESDINRPNPAVSLGVEPNQILHTAAEQFPFRGVSLLVHIVRALSVLLGAVTVWGTYQLGKLVTDNQIVALGAAGVVAFNPQFLFISGAMNNDNALTAFATLSIVVMTTILIQGWTPRRGTWLGIWIGLAILSKFAAILLIPPAAFVVIVLTIRERAWRQLLKSAIWIGLPVVLITGWWFVRNQILYYDPLGYQMFVATHGMDNAPKDFSQVANLIKFARSIHMSFWGNFGWLKIPLSAVLYDAFGWLYVFALLSAVIGAIWRREIAIEKEVTRQRQGWIFMVVVATSGILWTIIFGRGQGRYLFPVISAIAVLIVGGISAFMPDRLRVIPLGALVGGLSLLAVNVPGQYIAPTYRFFTVPESALATVPYRLQATFSPEIGLGGYRLVTEPGSNVEITLYWHAQGSPPNDYKIFIHALMANGQVCGQEDSLPLNGAFPMTVWRAGDVIEDTHLVPVDPECWQGTGRRLEIGLYREDTGERLLYSLNGQPVSDHLEIALDH